MTDPVIETFTRMLQGFKDELKRPNRRVVFDSSNSLWSHDIARREVSILEDRIRDFAGSRRTTSQVA